MQEDYNIDYYLKKIENGRYNKKRYKVKTQKKCENFWRKYRNLVLLILIELSIFSSWIYLDIVNNKNEYKDCLHYLLPHKVEQVEINEFNDQINKYIWENNNIGEDEKKVISSYYNEYLKDQAQYFNNKETLENVQDLTILYKDDLDEKYLYNARNALAATYDNIITMNNITEFNPDETEVLHHEFVHILQLKYKKYYFLTEAIAEENSDKTSYAQQRILTSFLCQLVGKDAVLKGGYTGDVTDIITELNKISGGKWNSKSLLNSAEDVHRLYKHISLGEHDRSTNANTKENQNLEKNKQKQKECLEKFISQYAKLYQAKYNQDMMGDAYLAACTDFLLGTNYLNTPFYDPEFLQMTSVQKNFLKDEEHFRIDYVYRGLSPAVNFQFNFYPEDKKRMDLTKHRMKLFSEIYLKDEESINLKRKLIKDGYDNFII